MPVEIIEVPQHGRRNYSRLLKFAEMHLENSLDSKAATIAIGEAKRFKNSIKEFPVRERNSVIAYARQKLKDSIGHSVGYFHPDYQWAIFGNNKVDNARL